MKTTILEIQNEVQVRFHNLTPEIRRKLNDKSKHFMPGAKFTPAYRLGRWDGKVSFFDLSGRTYFNYMDTVLPLLIEDGWDVEVLDNRTPMKIEFDLVDENSYSHALWPDDHATMPNQPIVLRDYQVEMVNTFLENTTGVFVASTGSGKCVGKDTELDLVVDKNSDFGKLLPSTRIKIGDLAAYIEEFNKTSLKDCQEVSVEGISIDTPTGITKVLSFIRKENLSGVKIAFSNGYRLECASKHILQNYNGDVYADQLTVGDVVDHKDGPLSIVDIQPIADTDFFDISIEAPHLYYDANGLTHHNTLSTAVMCDKIAKYGRSILIVPSKDLVTQTERDFKLLGLDVGVFFGDRKEYGKTHTICTWQSLGSIIKRSKKDDIDVSIDQFLEGVKGVIVDEVHTVGGDKLRDMLLGHFANVPIRWGLTGTIPKDDVTRITIQNCIGFQLGKVTAKELQDKGVLSNLHVEIMQLEDISNLGDYHAEYSYLTTNLGRLKFLAKKFEKIAQTGNTLILVNRIETGQTLADLIPNSVFINGSVKSTNRKEEYDKVKIEDGKTIIATAGVASTGIDIGRVFNVILFEPGKSFVRVIQSIGRGIRKAHDKDFVRIYDVTSTARYSKKHLIERKKYYREAEYPFSVEKIQWI